MRILFIIHDHAKSQNDFPLGVAYLISALREAGWENKDIDVYNMDVYHYQPGQLHDFLKRRQYDLVGIGAIAGYWQYRQVMALCEAINSLKNRPLVVLGGHMPSPEPAYFMRKTGADFVVMGEGEIVFTNMVKRLSENGSPHDLKGIAYWQGDKVIVNHRERLIKDLDAVPFPAWDKFPMEHYVLKQRFSTSGAERTLPVLSSRGCLYKCSFCYRMDKGYRMRSIDSVIEEVKKLVKDYNLNKISFRDELLMATAKRAYMLAERILKENINIKFDIDGRLNAVTPEVLDVLRRAGCIYINYGVESLDQEVLHNINKKQTIEEIIRGVELTVKAGINPGLNVVYGNIGDNEQTIQKTVDFLLKYNTYAEIRTLKPVTPYPGCELYHKAIELGLLEDCADFYENKHVNSDLLTVNFTEMTEEKFYETLYKANEVLIRDHFNHVTESAIRAHQKLYFEKDASFRGVRV